jgi:galactose mutarotase-like enzyme
LRPGWNSYEAPPPGFETLDFALLFAARTCVFLVRHGLPLLEPFLVPTSEGGVQLEWSHESRELEIEISRPGRFLFLAVEGDHEQEGACAEEMAFQHLRWLATGESP